MHPIYHTEALILSAHPKGEANMVYGLLTKDMGLVYAVAQGVRLEKSKLRYSLQNFSYIKVDLVQGKEVWRITSATAINAYATIYKSTKGIQFLSNVSKLLRRLMQGEVFHPEVLADTVTALSFLNEEEATPEVYHATELTLVLRILKELGYISDSTIVAPYVTETFNPSAINFKNLEKKTIAFEINRALRESQL